MRCLPLLVLLPLLAVAQEPERVRSLESYGDLASLESAQAALAAAFAELGPTGGILIIPTDAPARLVVRSTTQRDGRGPGVTVIDYRDGFVAYHVPPIGKNQTELWAGLRISRFLNISPRSLEHWGSYANLGIQNYIISGTSSYMQPLLNDVAAGENRRVYVDTVRGIWIGQQLTVTSSVMGYAEPVDFTHVKSIGWDQEQRRNYFTADFKHDHSKGALAHNKHNVKGFQLEGYSQSDNQSMAMQVVRNHHAVGDNFVLSGTLKYASDIFSGFGDEGGIVVNAETIGVVESFHSTVEAVDWSDNAVTYAPGLTFAHYLATSRPLINLNRDKWLTTGEVRIVGSGMTFEEVDYPGQIGGLGNVYNYQGGRIIGSRDCPWTADVIGRYFAVDEPTEMILPDDPSSVGGYAQLPSRPVHRWYRIEEFEELPDGRKAIKIFRVRWSAPPAGAPKLFLDDNYTNDDRDRPLRYVIAPGAWVYDISEGWNDVHGTGGRVAPEMSRKIRVAPGSDRGTRFDFEVGDEIEQAIGPDPWQPRPLRIRQFDQLPSTMPNATIEVQQLGRVQVPFGISLHGIIQSSKQLAGRKDGKPPWGTMIELASLAEIGIEFKGEVTDSAIVFRQPNGKTQPIRWRNDVVGSSSLEVEPATGDFKLRGGNLELGGKAIAQTRGISATATAANNLRGIDVPVPEGTTELEVTFGTPEADAAYAVSLTPSWVTALGVPQKTAAGFRMVFASAAPAAARVDWILVR